MNQLADLVLIGYFLKQTIQRPDWLKNPGVLEICSVSDCLSKGPTDWIQKWKHNEWGFYDTEELAWQVADAGRARLQLFAYKLFPFRWLDDKQENFPLTAWLAPLADTYQSLGFDIVTRSGSSFFECSPLSCNSAADLFPVNEFCLIDDWDQANQVLIEISRDGHYEPGPYYLVQVYRRKTG